MSTAIVTHKDCILHDTGIHHPESQERLLSVFKTLKNFKSKKIQWIDGPNINLKHINLVHSEHHIKNIINNVPTKGFFNIDADTVLSPNSIKSAFKAMGSVCKAVDLVCTQKFNNAFCPVRPPGHHAEPNRAMGFCLFNNVAIGAYYAKLKYKLKKCAVIDFDVHHGNGTQHFFEERSDIYFVSMHQDPRTCYPGTGFADERGNGAGSGYTLNVPVPPGMEDEKYLQTFYANVQPKLLEYNPDFVLISAGFDAHRDDPLASLNLTERTFRELTMELKQLAEKSAGGRIMSLLEGGYDLNALASSVEEHLTILQTED